MKKWSVISNRRLIHAIISLIMVVLLYHFKVSLWLILIAGIASGVIFGKVFCRWMCPLGFFMELMLGNNSEAKQLQMYNYHKLGCPIAWVSGFMNRFSLFKIKRDVTSCVDCGICDSKCYISSMDKEYSLYKENLKNPGLNFKCSKCLACVESCPKDSLEFTASGLK